MDLTDLYRHCTLCPRQCGVDRTAGQRGFCGQPAHIRAARASLHQWEEPCLAGEQGAGTIFFTGCTMDCLFCQNQGLKKPGAGWPVSPERFAQICLELEQKGAACLDLVTPTMFLPSLIPAIQLAREQGCTLPVVYNTSGYEQPKLLRLLEGTVDVWLPDFKYLSPDSAKMYSKTENYTENILFVLDEMVRQQPKPVFDAQGRMKKGVLIRHLMLPGMERETRQILRTIQKRYGNQVWFSLMSQYTPTPAVADHPVLCRPVDPAVYQSTVRYALSIGLEQGFVQEEGAVSESFIPDFSTGEGILHSISLPDSHCFSFQQE